MAAIFTGNHPKALWPGVKGWFGVGYGEHNEEYRQIFDVISSGQNYEEMVEMKPFPLVPVKNEGTATNFTGQIQGYVKRYIHVAYSLGFIVTYEELKDNLYEKLASSRAKALGFSFRQTKETVHANILNRAFSGSYLDGGDAKQLLTTDHPSSAGDWQNELTTAADISETSLEDLLTLVMTAEDDEGHKINLMPEKLIVPPQLWWEANRILKSTLTNDSANNATNVIKSTNALPGGIVMNHYLTDSDAFFVKTNCPDGLTSFQRDSYDLKRDNDFDTDNAKAKSYDRYIPGWTNPRTLYGSPGVG